MNMKNKKNLQTKSFYGTASIGEKGQVVIPVEARKTMKLKKGDQLLVFGLHNEMLALVKLSQVEKIASHLSEKLKTINEYIKNK